MLVLLTPDGTKSFESGCIVEYTRGMVRVRFRTTRTYKKVTDPEGKFIDIPFHVYAFRDVKMSPEKEVSSVLDVHGSWTIFTTSCEMKTDGVTKERWYEFVVEYEPGWPVDVSVPDES